jgi:hypothetical protein
MPIHTKKAAVRNREVSINNQIASIFVNNNGVVSINPNAVPKYESKTATTSLAISGTYLIPLVSATSGVQGLNKSANLGYDTNTNTLQVQNLTTSYLPQCSAVPDVSNQLVNKAYLDQYVGSYNQLWIYEDWMNSDVSGSLNWYQNIGTNATISIIPSEIGHPGIVRLSKYRTTQFLELYLSQNISFTSKTVKCVRFLVRPFANLSTVISTTKMFLYLGPTRQNNSIDFNNCAYWHFTSYNNLFSVNDNTFNWSCCVNMNKANENDLPNPQASYNAGTLANKWVLFEIELNNQKPSFYITVIGATSRIRVYEELTLTIDSSVSIQPRIFVARNANLSGDNALLDIDYVDITYNKI